MICGFSLNVTILGSSELVENATPSIVVTLEGINVNRNKETKGKWASWCVRAAPVRCRCCVVGAPPAGNGEALRGQHGLYAVSHRRGWRGTCSSSTGVHGGPRCPAVFIDGRQVENLLEGHIGVNNLFTPPFNLHIALSLADTISKASRAMTLVQWLAWRAAKSTLHSPPSVSVCVFVTQCSKHIECILILNCILTHPPGRGMIDMWCLV